MSFFLKMFNVSLSSALMVIARFAIIAYSEPFCTLSLSLTSSLKHCPLCNDMEPYESFFFLFFVGIFTCFTC